jgi:septal ring factor EnvC (AmiA/AmiB activator)
MTQKHGISFSSKTIGLIAPKRVMPWLLAVCLLGLSSSALASTESMLNQLKSKIADIKSHLEKEQSTRSQYQKQLKQAELQASKLAQQLQKTAHSLSSEQQHLQSLQANAAQYQRQLAAQEAAFDTQIKAAYLTSQQPYLKLILNQQDPENIGRTLQYYRYINQDRLQAILELQNTLAKIERNQQEIHAQTQELASLKLKQQQEQSKLTSAQLSRKQALASLNQAIQTKSQKLAELMRNKRALERTLTTLNQTSTPYVLPTGQSFEQLRNKLAWPTRGQIVQGFGVAIEQSELQTNGVLIKAPLGQSVYAIAPGKVIFAKWMTGYGLLLIIDHGHHYMSLYGRNHALHKKVGDVVKGGEMIATVGTSGGYQQPELYFAIRHNAVPMNPALWCKLQP